MNLEFDLSSLQQVLEVLSPAIKQLGHDNDYLLPTIAKAKNVQSYISTPPLCPHGTVVNQGLHLRANITLKEQG
jgi:hypothetical protein